MYHGIPTNYEFYVIIFGVITWIIRGIVKAVQRVSRRSSAAPPLSVPGPSPTQSAPSLQSSPLQAQSFQAQLPQAQLNQTLPERVARLDAPRRRQPAAGGPVVSRDPTRTELERREQALFFSEPAALNTPLTSGGLSAAAPVRRLLGGPDDLVRAIILQEVLGPPLSRRSAPPAPAPPHSTPPQ